MRTAGVDFPSPPAAHTNRTEVTGMVTTKRVGGQAPDDGPIDPRYFFADGYLSVVEMIGELARRRGVGAEFCRTLKRVAFETEGAVYKRVPLGKFAATVAATVG
jgi:hypothetical protein